MATMDTAFKDIKALVNDFKANEHFYTSAGYQEQEARKDFIDKFLIALGWDVNHDEQKNPFEQEVKVERSVNVHGAQKRADYAFYIQPDFQDVRFFLEAKRPGAEIATPDNYFQAVRYGWNAQTPLVALTSFAQCHILDCRYKPDINSTAQRAIKTYHYSEYADKVKFAEIYWLLSHEAAATGALERFADALPKRKGKAVQQGLFAGAWKSIDEAFLEELDEYRLTLAHMFKAADASLDGDSLTEIVQRTLDRLVFMRFLEDRHIEPDPLVAMFGDKGRAWDDFISTSGKLNGIYNGIVFKPHAMLDNPALKVEDAHFAEIREKLSHLNSPYDFNIIPIHILGSIYERFLGKVITAGDKRAVVKDKPEVRKAGGVYYTPEYIVRYIVANTVGKIIAGKTLEQIAELRFADISCGSGSFLLGMYDTLLKYHQQWYNEHRAKAKKGDCVERDGTLHLTLKKRREILLNNIYGVDIDAQAVEVAQLSLYLKLLDEETLGTANEYQQEFHETLLPTLNKNIVCGNSLIGTDILKGDLFKSDEEERKIKPMDFDARFKDIMMKGGFDCIVGNPPYVKARDYDDDKHFYRDYINDSGKYQTVYKMWDLYIPFIEKGMNILKKEGLLSMIVPDTIEKADYAELLRKWLVKYFYVYQIDFFPHSKIFHSDNKVVGVKNTIIFVSKNISKGQTKRVYHSDNYKLIDNIKNVDYADNIFIQNISKINFNRSESQLLGDVCFVSYGLRLNSDKENKQNVFRKNDLLSKNKSKVHTKLFVDGKNLKRYRVVNDLWLEWDSERCPRQLVRPTFNEMYLHDKILLGRQTRVAVLDLKQRIVDNTIIVCMPYASLKGVNNKNLQKYFANISKPRNELEKLSANVDLNCLLGIINSKLIKYFCDNLTQQGIDMFPDDWKKIPIPIINERNRELGKNICTSVEQIHKSLIQHENAKTDQDKSYYENKCASLDRQIDESVYKLYGLTDEEIGIVEENTKRSA